MYRIEVWSTPTRWTPDWVSADERSASPFYVRPVVDVQIARARAAFLAETQRHPYRVVVARTGREVGRFTGER